MVSKGEGGAQIRLYSFPAVVRLMPSTIGKVWHTIFTNQLSPPSAIPLPSMFRHSYSVLLSGLPGRTGQSERVGSYRLRGLLITTFAPDFLHPSLLIISSLSFSPLSPSLPSLSLPLSSLSPSFSPPPPLSSLSLPFLQLAQLLARIFHNKPSLVALNSRAR